MNQREFNKNLTIIYKNGQEDHGIFEYDMSYSDGRVVRKSFYVYKSELEDAKKDIINFYNLFMIELKNRGIVRDIDYEKIDERTKQYDKLLKDERRQYTRPNTVDVKANLTELIHETEAFLKRKKRVIIKFVSVAVALVIAAHGGFALQKSMGPEAKTRRIDKTVTSIENHLDNIPISDIDEMLEIFSSPSYSNKALSSTSARRILGSIKYNSSFERDVVERFEEFALLSGGSTNDYENPIPYDFCLYGSNLIMGGDRYSYDISPLPQVLKGDDQAVILEYVYGIAKSNNASIRRVRDTATMQEANLFSKLPAIVKVIMLSQLEMKVREIGFVPHKEDTPSWWNTRDGNKAHTTDTLLEEIANQKQVAIEQLHSEYLSQSQRKI